MTSQRKLYMVGICSTEQKRAKRMPDNIVETTINNKDTLEIINDEVKLTLQAKWLDDIFIYLL